MSDQFWLFCNTLTCRVVEFYTGDDGDAEPLDNTCPACGNAGDEDAY